MAPVAEAANTRKDASKLPILILKGPVMMMKRFQSLLLLVKERSLPAATVMGDDES